MVVYILFEMPSEGSRARMGAGMLAEDLPAPILPVVPARGSDPCAARHRHALLGRSASRNGFGRQTGRATVQHRRVSGVRVPGRMGVPHAHLTCARRHAPGRNRLQERRPHPHRRPLHRTRVNVEVRVRKNVDPLELLVFRTIASPAKICFCCFVGVELVMKCGRQINITKLFMTKITA